MRESSLQDIIAINDLREMMRFFHEGAGLAVGIIDNEGDWLISLGWQRICVNFHRINPTTKKKCLLCEARIKEYLQDEDYLVYRCPNGLVEVAIPLILENRTLGYFFLGQFFQTPPEGDYFRRQALGYGFDVDDYLTAVARVPVVSEQRIDQLIHFFMLFFDLLMRVGAENRQRKIAEREMEQVKKQLEVRVKERTSELNDALMEIGDLAAQLTEYLQQVEHLAVTDLLTQTFNRRKFDEIVDTVEQTEEGGRQGFSLIMLDIDHFKRVNDRFGHSCGDEVLKHLCRLIRALIRQGDLLIRWGGEEFLVLLPETSVTEAGLLAERIRAEVEVESFAQAGCITISLGVAQLRPSDSIDELIKRVDQALYQAKQRGRNRVVTEGAL